MKESEQEIQNRILNALNYAGHHVFRINAGKIKIGKGRNTRLVNLAPKGTSDIIGIHKDTGQFMALEVKTPARKNTVTEYQQDFLDRIEERGGIARVVTGDEDIDDLL